MFVDLKTNHSLKFGVYFIRHKFLELHTQEIAFQVTPRELLWGGEERSQVI